MSKKKQNGILMRLIQGALIGTGAILPGISGGVLMVIFGIYQPIMSLLAHPFKTFKENMKLFLPVIIGVGLGVLGISKILGFLLDAYPDQSVCLFVGLIGGMLPSLFREAGEKGRGKSSWVALIVAFIVIMALLLSLQVIQVEIVPNLWWYLFCGFCLALSVIAPGMSFSTLLMPLGLYTPFIAGIGDLNFSILIPAGIGAVLTVILFAKAVTTLLDKHYAPVFHGIIGIVIAATLVIIPFQSFTAGVGTALINLACIAVGVIAALALDKFNSSVEKPD